MDQPQVELLPRRARSRTTHARRGCCRLAIQAREPSRLLLAEELGEGALHKGEEVVAMTGSRRGGLARLLEPLQRIVADGVEQPVALALGIVHDQRFLHQPREQVEELGLGDDALAADRLGCLDGESAREHAQPAQQRPLAQVEQVVAPVDEARKVCCRGARFGPRPKATRSGRSSAARSDRLTSTSGARRQARWRAGCRRGGDRCRPRPARHLGSWRRPDARPARGR